MKSYRFDIPLIIFDNECPACRFFSKIARKLKFQTRPIQESSEILKKIMGDNFPFALYLIDSQGIYWGKEAAKRILEIRGHRFLSYLAYFAYPIISLVNANSKKYNKGICKCQLHGKRYFNSFSA